MNADYNQAGVIKIYIFLKMRMTREKYLFIRGWILLGIYIE